MLTSLLLQASSFLLESLETGRIHQSVDSGDATVSR